METPNVLNEVLAPDKQGGRPTIVPVKEGTIDVVLATATGVQRLRLSLQPLNVDAAWRKSMAGQNRVNNAASTAVCLRLLGHKSVAEESKMQPVGVKNLMLLDAGVGALRYAAWPITLHGLLRTQKSGARADDQLAAIDEIAARPGNEGVLGALGTAEDIQRRGARSDQATAQGRKKHRAAATQTATQAQATVDSARRKHQLVTNAGSGQAPPQRPATTGKGSKSTPAGQVAGAGGVKKGLTGNKGTGPAKQKGSTGKKALPGATGAKGTKGTKGSTGKKKTKKSTKKTTSQNG